MKRGTMVISKLKAMKPVLKVLGAMGSSAETGF